MEENERQQNPEELAQEDALTQGDAEGSDEQVTLMHIAIIAVALLVLAGVLFAWYFGGSSGAPEPVESEPAPEETTEPEEEFVPPSVEEREAQLEALEEKKNPYDLSEEERRAQFDALKNRSQ